MPYSGVNKVENGENILMGIWSPAAESAARRWWGWGVLVDLGKPSKIWHTLQKILHTNSPSKKCGVSGDRLSTIRKIYVSGIVERLIQKPSILDSY